MTEVCFLGRIDQVSLNVEYKSFHQQSRHCFVTHCPRRTWSDSHGIRLAPVLTTISLNHRLRHALGFSPVQDSCPDHVCTRHTLKSFLRNDPFWPPKLTIFPCTCYLILSNDANDPEKSSVFRSSCPIIPLQIVQSSFCFSQNGHRARQRSDENPWSSSDQLIGIHRKSWTANMSRCREEVDSSPLCSSQTLAISCQTNSTVVYNHAHHTVPAWSSSPVLHGPSTGDTGVTAFKVWDALHTGLL